MPPSNLLRNRNFALLWAGESVSCIGTQITVLAVPLTAVKMLGASPLQMGYLQACEFAPFLLVTLFAGVWIDRNRRRPVLLAANLGLGMMLAVVPLAATQGWLQMPLLYSVAACIGSLTVFLQVAMSSFMPSVVPPKYLVDANSRLELSRTGGQIIGPGIAGLLLSVLAAPFALILNSISYFACALGVSAVRVTEQKPAKIHSGVWADILEGLKATFGSPYLRAMVAVATSFNFFFQGLATLFILHASRDLGMPTAAIALVFTAESIGGFLGAFVSNAAVRRLGFGKAVLAASFIGCVGPLIVAFAHRNSLLALPLCLTGYFMMSFGITAFNVQTITLRQVMTSPHVLGRVNASARALIFGAIPIGALAVGYLAQHLGAQVTLLIAGTGTAMTWLILVFSPIGKITASSAGEVPVLKSAVAAS